MSLQNSSRVLAVGGAGYVGSAFCALLAKQGVTFAALDNFSVNSEESFQQHGWDYYRADITDKQAVMNTVRDFKPTHIINLAALHFIPYCVANPEETQAVNVTGTRNLVEAIVAVDPSIHFTLISSAAVYRDAAHALAESDELGPIDIYGESKLAGEQIVRSQLSNFNIIRLFNVYGRHDPHPHVIPRIYAELMAGKDQLELGDTRPQRDFVHVDDVASALYAVLNRGVTGSTYNIGTGKAHSIQKVLESLFEHCDNYPQIHQNTPDYNRATDRMMLLADIASITTDTGWQPSFDFEQGLQTLS